MSAVIGWDTARKESRSCPISNRMDPNSTPSSSDSGGESPEQYIRTFHGDIDIFNRGGTPGLAPLKRPHPKPSERLIESSPIASVPKPPPEQSEPSLDLANLVDDEPKLETKPQVQRPEVISIKTYSDDFTQRLKETHASTATVLAAEQDAAPLESVGEPIAPDTHSRWYIVAGILLVVSGAVGIFFAYTSYRTGIAPVVFDPTIVAPIFVDTTEQISGSGRALVQAINQSVAKPLSANAIRQLTLESATSTGSMFLSLGAPIPGILVRNINPTGSTAGVVNANGTQSPFFILSVTLYSATFSGMLSWEPSMQRDLKALYPLYPSSAAATSSTATTSSQTASTTEPAAPSRKEGFRDEIVSNHDVRIYRDSAGRSILLYGYWNPSTLIIARDPVAFAALLDRLATSRAR